MAYLTPSTASGFTITLPAGTGSVTNPPSIDLGNGNNKFLIAAIGLRNAVGLSNITFSAGSFSTTLAGTPPVGSQAQLWVFVAYLGSGNHGVVSTSIGSTGAVGPVEAAFGFMVFDNIEQENGWYGYDTATGSLDAAAVLELASQTGHIPIFLSVGRTTGTIDESGYTQRIEQQADQALLGGGEGVGASTVNFAANYSSEFNNGWAAVGLNLIPAEGGGGPEDAFIDLPVISLLLDLADGGSLIVDGDGEPEPEDVYLDIDTPIQIFLGAGTNAELIAEPDDEDVVLDLPTIQLSLQQTALTLTTDAVITLPTIALQLSPQNLTPLDATPAEITLPTLQLYLNTQAITLFSRKPLPPAAEEARGRRNPVFRQLNWVK